MYLLTSKKAGHQVLIDAADDADAIKSMLEQARADSAHEARVAYVATTHSH